jgi:hypothetical protein
MMVVDVDNDYVEVIDDEPWEQQNVPIDMTRLPSSDDRHQPKETNTGEFVVVVVGCC